jgi:CheY-like chemotaxis protein
MKILIVEDHADSAQAMARVLGKLGYEASIAPDCASALAAASASRPDLALCDLGLPDGDGYDLMVALRDQYNIRSAAVTGYGESFRREQCNDAGFDVVLKPFQVDQLSRTIERMLPPS